MNLKEIILEKTSLTFDMLSDCLSNLKLSKTKKDEAPTCIKYRLASVADLQLVKSTRGVGPRL